jgi:hypothetical protein
MNEMRYLPDDELWLLPSPEGLDCEILVGGDQSSPDPVRLALVLDATAAIERLQSEARSYLESFVDPTKVGAEGQWHLEGLKSEPRNETTEQCSLYFSIENDLYGEWSVTFEVSTGKYYPVAFSRRQL